MKLKKIISAFAAIAMLASMVTVANAAHAAYPTIEVTSKVFEDTSASNYKAVDGYTTYQVSYKVTGIDLIEEYPTAVTIDYTISADDLAVIDVKSWKSSVTSGAPANRDLNGVYALLLEKPQMVSNKQIAFANVNGVELSAWANGDEVGVPATIIDTLIYVKNGESVDITYNTALTGTQTSSLIVMTGGSKYDDEIKYNVNGTGSNVLTLGGSAAQNVTSVNKVVDTADGYVWQVAVDNFVNDAITWKFESAGEADQSGSFNLAAIETRGTITFDVILVTEKEVTLTVE